MGLGWNDESEVSVSQILIFGIVQLSSDDIDEVVVVVLY